ncbi:hypothetical protein F511_29368 [Dorcoceras hygrometricum]|uniref:Uncharacterized protein n=1 Tax=Dorcoceras hygrometricum TaxID=472368 RepID=A0A2Z7BP50_9LAMI|nr:hypothetical protein F511_29368 [Dorcoceras hygrometricum]
MGLGDELIGLMRSGGVATRGDANKNWDSLPNRSGLCAQVELPSEEVSIKIGLRCRAGRVMRSGGVATRGCANKNGACLPNGSGLCAQVGLPPEESDSKNHEL